MEMNKYQTPLTEELLNQYPNEVLELLLELINTIPFIKNLISPSRQYAKDRPRDSKGRIIVDLANPHILENMDYFRPAALHFKKYGCYTKLKPNPNPHSEYGKWIREERRRCWEGMVRESDGEWITGFMYFYLNYCPIMLAVTENNDSVIASRVEDFPEVWEGIYWRFHYLELARRGGLYNDFKGGNHGAELARRGCSKSYTLASIMAHNFILGESELAHKRFMTILAAYLKEFLAGKDGTLSKFIPMIDFVATNTQFPRRRLKNSLQEMMWQMGYVDAETGVLKGTLNTVVGISCKDDPDKIRGKRGYIFFEEFGSFARVKDVYNIVRYGVEEGNKVFGLIYLVGTSGEDSNDFEGALELIYHPKGYNIYYLPNVFDKPNQGKPHFAFFFPAYVNRKGCYNKDGVSDIVAALLQILLQRYITKYNSSDPNTLIRVMADMPITPAEAIVRTARNMFPMTDLTQRLGQLDADSKILDLVLVADLVIDGKGKVEPKPSTEHSIREFPHKNNKILGAVEIYELPVINKQTGKPHEGRYILGADPYDNDEAETMSLGSVFVLDLWTDRIVAEYTGRPLFAEDYFEICRKLCIMYNGKLNYEAHPYDQLVRLSNGETKLWKDIKIGDKLFSPNRTSVTVIDIPIDGEDDIYRITLLDGRQVEASSNHIWNVYLNNHPESTVNITTKQMFDKGVLNRFNQKNFFLPQAKAVEYNYSDTPIDPYTLGLLIAEGAFTKFRKNKYKHFLRRAVLFSSCDLDAMFYKTVIPYDVKKVGNKGYSWHMYIDDIDTILSDLGLLHCDSHSKFIPLNYLINNYTTRLELLKGLMDGDGCATNGASVFVTVSKRLAEDVALLCRSLGMKVSVYSRNTCYRVAIATNISIFKLPRKVSKQHIYKPYTKGSKASSLLYKTAISNIQYVGRKKCKCITVDSLDGLYLIGDYIVTHNCNKKGLFSYFSQKNCAYLLTDVLEFLKEKNMAKPGYGNTAHPYNLLVYTPLGIKLWKDIKIGDYLYNTTGGVTKITDIPFDGECPIYRITLRDGRTIEASDDHLWKIIDWNGKLKVLSTKDILKGFYRNKGKYREFKYYIPANAGVNFESKNLPLPAYFIGLMLGDGCFTASSKNLAYFSSCIEDMTVYKTLIPYQIKIVDNRHYRWLVPDFKNIINDLNLADKKSHTKFIPDIYKYNNRENRLQLLRGLLDTDGHIDHGNPVYTSVSPILINDVLEVARSLGINCNKVNKINKYGKYYSVTFYTDILLFNLPRKANLLKLTKTRHKKTAITNIEFLRVDKAKCVTVDSADSCYLIGDYVTTHNSKGTTATAPVNAYAKNLLRKWLLESIPTMITEDGELRESQMPRLYTLKNRALLQELINYNTEGNFDRISAMGMLMLLREDKMILYQGDIGEDKYEKAHKSSPEYDDFFIKNYDNRLNKN